MGAASFDLTSHWTAVGPVDKAFDIITDPARLVDWWPEVYLDVDIVDEGDADGVGRAARLLTRGWLPYHLRWTAIATEVIRPTRIALRAEGDLNGRGLWTLSQDGETVRIRYDWTVDLGDGWMRRIAPLLMPVFIWNHNWAMRKGEAGLRRALQSA